MTIGIIGAGASGMAAALVASENKDAKILLFERQARCGRKLQATGNGRCNLSNAHVSPDAYHGNQADFVNFALEQYPVADTLAWFESLGLYTVTEPSGRIYPYSDQANSVVDVLRFALMRENISLHTAFEISRVRKDGNGFLVEGNEQSFYCDKLIIACGGLAGSKLGGSMSGYQLLRKFGHHVTKLRPALVQLKSDWHGCVSLKGVRANCHVEIYHEDILHAESTGELQFTEYGLSGPVIFEASRDACTENGQWFCRLDFLPEMTHEALFMRLSQKRNTMLNAEELFTGILHSRLGKVLTKAAGIKGVWELSQLTDEQLQQAVSIAKGLEVSLTEPMGMEHAQVTAGGIVTEEFVAETMESKLLPNLYACGEVLDVDGDCGGFNLQWAWSSGRLAGASAGGLL